MPKSSTARILARSSKVEHPLRFIVILPGGLPARGPLGVPVEISAWTRKSALHLAKQRFGQIQGLRLIGEAPKKGRPKKERENSNADL